MILSFMRYFIDLSYQGTQYVGWQQQPNGLSVQEVLENRLGVLLRQPVAVVGSGRTDAGVHASQQIVHFDSPEPLQNTVFLRKLNALLPADIAAKALYAVAPEAHARYDATLRSYRYFISPVKNPYWVQKACFDSRSCDWEKMNQAARILLEYEDFEAFSKVHTEVKHFRCQMQAAFWEQGHCPWQQSPLQVFHISANRFLRGMVRAIVGTLLQVGTGRLSLEDFRQVIEQKDRSLAGAAAPPQGLYLSEVHYPYPLQENDA